METKVNFAVVGAFVLVLGAAFIGGILWLSSGKSFRASYDTYLVYMSESVSGLSPDAPVRYRGVQVGRVRRISLAPGDVEKVLLTLDVQRGTPIKQDTIAVLQSQGLTGIAHVELSGGSRESPQLETLPNEEYPVIRSGPSLMLRLDTEVSALLENLNRSSERFNALLDDRNRNALKQTLVSLEAVSRTLAGRTAAIDSGVTDAALAMQNTVQVTKELSQLLERVQRSADAFDRMTAEGALAGASAARAMDSARTSLNNFSGQTLPDAQLLITELRSLTVSLKHLSDELERDPSMLVRGKSSAKPGPGE
ncbi:MAG TPA: MlaD family protein [Burkholderiaceae bacterium]|nr:MlaD family protein [Burkholderiaceae bacterium]